jgi:peroxiredoxin
MKKIFTIIIIGLLIVSCKKESRTDYLINGKAEGVYDGMRVYLKSMDDKGQKIIADSAVVFDKKFTMQGKVDAPEVHFLEVNGIAGNVIFMLENSEIFIEVNKQNITETTIEGSESNKSFVDFQDGMLKIREKGTEVMAAYRKVKLPEEAEKKDSITKELEKLGERLRGYPVAFIKENSDSYFSLSLVELESGESKTDIADLMESYNNLSPRLRESQKGIRIGEKLKKIYEEYLKIAHLEIGKIAPNFEAPTPNGEIVSLNELKGKVTIIDFWAAWCGPCRRENPNVVKVYEKFHNQGLEIIGVSLDGDRRQQDPKKAWLDAIEKDKLTWTHVSNLQYFNDPVAQMYNIASIPATFILDKDGKIAYKNLRGKELELKVQELLEQ